MGMVKKPVNGMKDILPAEMKLRNYVTGVIRKTYEAYGFSQVETPVVEHIENLLSKQGGENEKLIFRILKRGEKLDLSAPTTADAVSDSGLRYDLTLPLSRYYANNSASLPAPFKAIQIGSVFRADRPQRGRYRQFTQCDIDILGEPSCIAEIELILATTEALSNLGFSGFTVRINDRKILKKAAADAGISENDFEKVFILLDKADKIGTDGVKAALAELLSEETAEKYISSIFAEDADGLMEGTDLPLIMETVGAAKKADFRLVFDPTLVRGMGYYTGPIFEISIDGYGGSVGGGGRYDEMIGRFTGQATPAAGFSIGFERIILLLQESGFKVPEDGGKVAFLTDKKLPKEKLAEVFAEAAKLREEGMSVTVSLMKKNKKFQKDLLEAEGFEDIREVYAD